MALFHLGPPRLVRLRRLAVEVGAAQQQPAGALRQWSVVGGRQVEVDHEHLLGELCAAGQLLAVGRHHQRVAVEDQLVLAADQVDPRERAAGLRGPALAQLEAGVALLPLVGRTVDDEQQPGTRRGGGGGRSVAPDVLADRERHVDASDAHDVDGVTRDEVADLVAHAVVPQVVLGLADRDATAVQHRDGVLRGALGHAGSVGSPIDLVEAAEHDRQVAEPGGVETFGEDHQGLPCTRDERRP